MDGADLGSRVSWALGALSFFTAKFQVQDDQSERQTNPVHARVPRGVGSARVRPFAFFWRRIPRTIVFLNLFLSQAPRRSSIDIAENGEIAVRMFKSGHYDLVLMDVEMPVMDGSLATREIRRLENETGAPPTPVLALTAHAFADVGGEGSRSGVHGDIDENRSANVTLLEALVRYGPSRQTAHGSR